MPRTLSRRPCEHTVSSGFSYDTICRESHFNRLSNVLVQGNVSQHILLLLVGNVVWRLIVLRGWWWFGDSLQSGQNIQGVLDNILAAEVSANHRCVYRLCTVTCQIVFTSHVYYLFSCKGRREEWWWSYRRQDRQASDCSSSLCFDVRRWENTACSTIATSTRKSCQVWPCWWAAFRRVSGQINPNWLTKIKKRGCHSSLFWRFSGGSLCMLVSLALLS